MGLERRDSGVAYHVVGVIEARLLNHPDFAPID